MYQDQQGLRPQSYKENCREEEEKDKECAGIITSPTGHEGLRFSETLKEFKNIFIRKKVGKSEVPQRVITTTGSGAGVG